MMMMLSLSVAVETINSLSWTGRFLSAAGGCVVLFWMAVLYKYMVWRLSPLHQIPGPRQTFLSGSFREVRGEPFFAPHQRWCRELGYDKKNNLPLLHYTSLMGGHSLLVLDKEIVRRILTTQLITTTSNKKASSSWWRRTRPTTCRFHKGPIQFIRTRIGNGLVVLQGEDWRRHRRILQPSFQTTFLRNQLETVVPPAVQEFVAHWKLAASARHQKNREIDVSSHLSALTLDVVGKVLFSHDFRGLQAVQEWAQNAPNNDNDEQETDAAARDHAKIGTLTDPFLRSLQDNLKPALITIFLLSFRMDYLEGILNPRARRMSEALDAAAEQVICRALDNNNTNEKNGRSSEMHSKSLLHLMFEAEDPQQQQGGGGGRRGRLSREELRQETKTFLLAGHETTSTWLYWALYALAKHPDIQDRLHHEIVQHAGTTSASIGLQQVERMEYYQAFLQEVLRLYPPVGFISRFNTYPEEIAGYPIPAGTRMVIPFHILHRHPLYWDDPETFRPERWMNVSAAEQERRRYAFLPFSAGGRVCIGQRFADLEAQLILAPLVRALRILIAPSQRDTTHTFRAFITMKAKPDLRIVVEERA